jgi:hypothetical protein
MTSAHSKRPWLTAALVFVAMGCQTESASDLTTSQIVADISATATGSGQTNVNATFRTGELTLTFIELTSDDVLQAKTGTTTQTLSQFSLLGVTTYGTTMPVDADGTSFTVSLTRKKDSGAPSSVATLPPAFTVSPVSGTFSRADAGPTFDWSPAAADPMSLLITGSCIDDVSESIPANATSFAIAAGTLKKRTVVDGGTPPGDDCDATAAISRNRPGTLDPAYGNGTIVGTQARSVTFSTVP